MIRPLCWVLAMAATGTAICLSVLAGWQRGGSLAERLVWVAIGVVLVACAHLLPALVREASAGVHAVAAGLWLACMAAACFGHATFFVLAQRHAGELRAAAVPIADARPVGRSLTTVMAERATVTGLLATVNARRCSDNCTTLEARRVTLTAKLDALEAEAGEIRRRRAADDRGIAARDALVADPVTTRLAALLGTTVYRVELLSGLAFAAVLEGIACLLWTVTLRSRPPVKDVPPVATGHVPEPASHEPKSDSHAPVSEPVTPLPIGESTDPDVMTLAQAVAAGQVRPTVADIRRHLGCSQARATTLRRQLVALAST
ncbi:putative twin-arginine translocation pathway signal protein [Burkholderia pseudomallei]|nr:putative twin-arginine translocation pathway signal protein [Burkholderia pseudomallei]